MSDWSEAERHVERAHEHFEAGRWDEAESALRKALSINPHRAEWHFNLGLTLEAAGRWDAAIEALAEAHRLDGADVQTLILLGMTNLRRDDSLAAIAWLEAARRLDGTRHEPVVALIDAYAREGRHDDAEVAFYESLQVEGDHAAAYANIAESLIDRGSFERAISCLRESVSLDPSAPRVHARLAYAYSRTGRPERARQLYMRELRDNPGDVDTLLDLADLLIDMNRFGEAGEKLRRVLEQESDNADAHYSLGLIAERQLRDGEAIAAYTLVLRLDPEHPHARRRLAAAYLRRKRLAEAQKLLRREMRSFRAESHHAAQADAEELAHVLLRADLAHEAIPVARRLTELAPGSPAAWHTLSLAYFRIGERSRGLATARRALQLDPKHLSAIHNMALACIHDARWTRAAAYIRQGLAIAPDDAGLRRLRLTLRVRRAARAVNWVMSAVFRPGEGGRR